MYSTRVNGLMDQWLSRARSQKVYFTMFWRKKKSNTGVSTYVTAADAYIYIPLLAFFLFLFSSLVPSSYVPSE